MYSEKHLLQWLREGEGPTLDFKHAVTNLHKIARSITAFANSKGGILVIGIDDNKDILGVNVEAEKYQLNKALKNFCAPTLPLQYHIINFKGAPILVAPVPESQSKPIYAIDKKGNKKLYVRIQDNCVIADSLFEEYLLNGSLNNPMIAYSVYENVRQKVAATFENHGTLSAAEYAKMAGLEEKQATRRLLDMVLNGLLLKEENNANFYLAKQNKSAAA